MFYYYIHTILLSGSARAGNMKKQSMRLLQYQAAEWWIWPRARIA